MTPLDLLLPYQRDFVLDDSRFKIWLAARQIGKSFACAMEVSIDCYKNPGATWIILSAGERQALEMMEKVKQCLTAWDMVIAWEGISIDTISSMKCAEVRLKNGSRVIALPANPATARGFTGNLVLDEFAFHRDPIGIWRAIFAAVTNPLKGQLKIRIISTPNGQGGQGSQFYSIWTGIRDAWNRHRTTILDAKAAGLAVDIDALRKAAGDIDTWRQEYLCEFIDGSRVAFPYDLISPCESSLASLTMSVIPDVPLFLGIDIGTISDPTVCYTLARENGLLVTKEIFSAKGVELSDQDDFIIPRIERAARVEIDASGIGRDLAQRMCRRFGGKVTARVVTPAWKRQTFQSLIAAMSDRRILLPADTGLRDDLHSYEVSGAGETARYHAPRTDDGHSDQTSALVHAFSAAGASQYLFTPTAVQRDTSRLRGRRDRSTSL